MSEILNIVFGGSKQGPKKSFRSFIQGELDIPTCCDFVCWFVLYFMKNHNAREDGKYMFAFAILFHCHNSHAAPLLEFLKSVGGCLL